MARGKSLHFKSDELSLTHEDVNQDKSRPYFPDGFIFSHLESLILLAQWDLLDGCGTPC